MAEESEDVADRMAETVSGDIYVRLDGKAEERIAEVLSRAARTRRGRFALSDGGGAPFEQVRAVLFPSGTPRTFFASNASTRAPRECRLNPCTLGEGRESCVLARRSCSSVVLRPDADAPGVAGMFPGNEILGLKARVFNCPHRPEGALLSVEDVVWLPKCERRPYEAAVRGRLFYDDGSPMSWRRAGNAFRAPLFERLQPVSLRTKEQLREWLDYLDWRTHLMMATKVGVRYVAVRIDVQRRNLVFTAVAENCGAFGRNRFWERFEPVYACRTDNSGDAWTYRERTWDECRQAGVKKDYGVELGDYEGATPRLDLARALAQAETGCPWPSPYIVDIAFALDGKVAEKMDREGLDRTAAQDEVMEFMRRNLKVPASGFLTLSSIGDEVLIGRQRRALVDFGERGSTAAPFLSNYLFDIGKARVPEKVEMPAEFLNRDLNASQRQAVATILSAPDVALVQGPPGTGKTTVIAEALWQFVRQDKRVLVVSQSGAAVDNALDRLANVPEIRAIRLQKERRGGGASDEDSRYAPANAVGNFYQALGTTARRRLDEWSAASARLVRLGDLRTRLENLLDRVDAEDRLVAGNAQERDAVLGAAEAESLPALRLFEALGVKVFEPAYNPAWPFANKRRALGNALRRAVDCERECLPRLEADIRQLKGLAGETVMSDEAALRVAELKRRAAEVQGRLEDNPEDDALFDRLSHELRDLRRQLRAVQSEAGFNDDAYRRHFGTVLPPNLGRTDLLARLEPLAERLSEASAALARTGLRRLEGVLLALDESSAAAQARRRPFVEEAEALLASARAELGLPGGTPAAARTWCGEEEARLRATLASTQEERDLLGPLYGAWLDSLAQPTDSDLERVLPEYVRSCSIVGMTCTSDSRILEQNGFGHFDVVLIDEVSKATPPELLMAMGLAEKAVLVGDHRQLPPLFGSREPLAMEEIMARDEEDGVEESRRVTRANFRKYEKMVGASLFKLYFEQAPESIKCTLWEQYRMHPDIMQLVNVFYDGHLTCGLADADRRRDHGLAGRVPWMRTDGHAFWIDSTRDPDGRIFEEEQSGSSKVNRLEVELVVQALRDVDAALDAKSRAEGREVRRTVGVIAFYGHQKRLLRRAVQKLQLAHLSCRIDTVDRFQGQERDYVLVSMTRNRARHFRNDRASNAYVAKFERINVAFSRARELLLVFGAADMFVDYNVSLPPLLSAGAPKVQPVYRRMIAGLSGAGRLVDAAEVFSREAWKTARARTCRK